MSNSKNDRRGPRIAGEILGRGCFSVTAEGRIIAECGGEEVGSPLRKKEAKAEATRKLRRLGRRAAIDGLDG